MGHSVSRRLKQHSAVVIKKEFWLRKAFNYRIRTNIDGYNIWRFVEIKDLARY